MKKCLTFLLLMFSLYSCEKSMYDYSNQTDKLVVIYMADNNNLSSYAQDNFAEILEGTLPKYFDINSGYGDILLVYTRNRTNKEPSDNSPELIRVSRTNNGSPKIEVIQRFDSKVNSATPEMLKKVLTYSVALFPAYENGLILWSHGSGWVEGGEFSKSNTPDYAFGYENKKEINIPELANALPLKYSFIIFDACLMGGVEVAYELKDKTDYLIASPTEIMGSGFPYKKIFDPIFTKQEIDLIKICDAYFNFYKESSAPWATIALVKTSTMEQLANAAKKIVSKYDINLDNLEGIQKYYRFDKHWFYDLLDYYKKICTEVDKDGNIIIHDEFTEFEKILYNTVIYKLNTEEFIDFQISSFSGLSTYIPYYYNESAKDEYYKNYTWCKKVGLVK